MQEREKTRIVIASVLKPTDDTRMTEKMGHSLACSGAHEVTVIGYPSSGAPDAVVNVVSLKPFRRISLARWWARWQVFGAALARRPDVFIFTTYELVLPAILLKVIQGTRIIYDVRENYYRNIVHSEGLPWLLRLPLALYVRFIEKVAAPAIDYFFLAEQGYDSEFRFHRGGYAVLENKALPNPAIRSNARTAGLHLLFSGTLSESTGVFRAIRLATQLHEAHPDVHLTIAGYAASQRVRTRIYEETKDMPFIRLVGIDTLVPHAEILSLISRCHAGIIAYARLPHTANSVPTKLFEYLHASLPIITERGWPWVARFEASAPFIWVNFQEPNSQKIISDMTTHTCYTKPAADVDWASEEAKLLKAISIMV